MIYSGSDRVKFIEAIIHQGFSTTLFWIASRTFNYQIPCSSFEVSIVLYPSDTLKTVHQQLLAKAWDKTLTRRIRKHMYFLAQDYLEALVNGT